MSAVALLSGGLDSFVAACLVNTECSIELALTCDYGHRAASQEIEAAKEQAHYLNAAHRVVDISWLGDLSEDALTSLEIEVPAPDLDDLDDLPKSIESMQIVWVPNRNGVMLNIAAAFAERAGHGTVVVGYNTEEGATFPDNTPGYVAAMNAALRMGTQRPQVQISSPTLDLTKPEIVQAATRRGFSLQLIYSCYHDGPGHCWKCESCLRLKRALVAAERWDDLGSILSSD
jgi:7-cyano-7-deazaguanine synthase